MIQRLHCPICDQPAPVIFSRPYRLPALKAMIGRPPLVEALADKSYEVRRCGACDLGFQTWVMEEGELPLWYSAPGGEESFPEEIGKQRLHWLAHPVAEILVFRQVCPASRPVVLDFGCNWGKWASAALALGCDVFAVEVNRAAADFCARRGIKIVSPADLPRLRFDFINVDQVLEHLSDPLSVARQLAGCLPPGGLLKLSTPDDPRLLRSLAASQRTGDDALLDKRTLDALSPLEHVNLFSFPGLASLGARLGLRPYRQPFFKWLGAGQLWNLPRQLNMNFVVPFKRRFVRDTYVWFQRPGPTNGSTGSA